MESGTGVGRVDYNELPANAKMIREDGKDLANTVISVYKEIEEMRANWHGIRYNEFIGIFNNMIPSFREILTLCVTTLPVALEQIANNYAVVDTGSKIVAVSDETPAAIPEIPACGDTDLRFIQAEVANVKTSTVAKFDIMLDIMEKISTEIANLPWKSDASEMFRSRFEELRNNIVRGIEDIRTGFDRAMLQSSQDVQEAETKNTVG